MCNSLSFVSLLFFWRNGYIDDFQYRRAAIRIHWTNDVSDVVHLWYSWWNRSVVLGDSGLPDHIWDSEDGWLPVSLLPR